MLAFLQQEYFSLLLRQSCNNSTKMYLCTVQSSLDVNILTGHNLLKLKQSIRMMKKGDFINWSEYFRNC